jgi:hypothetical protein
MGRWWIDPEPLLDRVDHINSLASPGNAKVRQTQLYSSMIFRYFILHPLSDRTGSRWPTHGASIRLAEVPWNHRQAVSAYTGAAGAA